MEYIADEAVSKETVAQCKNDPIAQGYTVRSINSMLASLNSLLVFLGWEDCKVINIRLQHQTFSLEEKELSRAEYQRLLQACEGDELMNLHLQTISASGIRISELQYFTVNAMKQGQLRRQGQNDPGTWETEKAAAALCKTSEASKRSDFLQWKGRTT